MTTKLYSIEEAIRRFNKPELLVRLTELEPHMDQYTVGKTDHLHAEARRLREQSFETIRAMLEDGVLKSKAIWSGSMMSIGYQEIPPELWQDASWDPYFDDIVLDELHLKKVKIWEDEADVKVVAEGWAASEDFLTIWHGSERCALGSYQAYALQKLFEAAQTDDPWLSGKRCLHPKSKSRRLQDIVKSNSTLAELIQSNGHGLYRLKVSLAIRS